MISGKFHPNERNLESSAALEGEPVQQTPVARGRGDLRDDAASNPSLS